MEERARALLAEGASRLVVWQRPCSPSSSTSTSTSTSSSSSVRLLFSSFPSPTNDEELRALERLFEDRESAIKSGIVIEGKRFEVHRHHPPLIYGREMGTAPALAEGAAVCLFESGEGKGGGDGGGGERAGTGDGRKENENFRSFAAISYPLPHVSARMVPLLQAFCAEVFNGGVGGGEGNGGVA